MKHFLLQLFVHLAALKITLSEFELDLSPVHWETEKFSHGFIEEEIQSILTQNGKELEN